MPLEPRVVAFPFVRGLDTKAGDLVPSANLDVAENVVFTRPGALTKRNGFEALRQDVAPVGSINGTAHYARISGGSFLAGFGDELLLASGGFLYSWSEGQQQWIVRDNIDFPTATSLAVTRDEANQTQGDGAMGANGVRFHAWEDSRGGVWWCAIDGSTGQVVRPAAQLDANGIKPRVLAWKNGNCVLLWYNTSDTKLHLATIGFAEPLKYIGTGTAITDVSADANSVDNTAPNYDAAVFRNGFLYIVFNNRATGTSLWWYDSDSTIFKTDWSGASVNLCVFEDVALSAPVALYRDSVPKVAYRTFTADLSATQGPEMTVWQSIAASTVTAVAGVGRTGSAGNPFDALDVLYTYLGVGDPADYRVTMRAPNCTPSSVSAPATFLKGAGLAGKPFGLRGTSGALRNRWHPPLGIPASAGWGQGSPLYAAQYFVPVAFDGTGQETWFVADSNARIVARVAPGNSGGSPARTDGYAPMLPSADTSGAVATWTVIEKHTLLSTAINDPTVGPVMTSRTGLSRVEVDFGAVRQSRAEIAGALHVGAGIVRMYDSGGRTVEHGFHAYPEITSPVSLAGSGGSLSAGAYQWRACYEWTDASGRLHRSAPSAAVTATAAASDKATVTVRCLRLTDRDGTNRSHVSIVLYRTKADLNTYFRVSGTGAQVATGASAADGPTQNNPASYTVTIVDGVSDATIGGNPPLYSDGSSGLQLENIEPGAVSSLVVWGNRLWALDPANPLSLLYSQVAGAGIPVEFSDGTLEVGVDSRGGAVTALGSLDDLLVVFKKDRIFGIAGSGPDKTGATGTTASGFTDTFLLTTDVGCTNPRSIVTVPDGLVFQSAKGIYHLGRDRVARYIGAAVEQYNDDTVLSAVLVPQTTQVRLLLDSGVALVHDYGVGQWSVFTPVASVDSCVVGNRHVWLRSDGAAMRETPGVWSDGGAPVRIAVETDWIQFAGVQGRQRIWKVLVLGQYASAHSLRVRLAWEFNPGFVQDAIVTPASPGTWGSDATWGSGDAWGGLWTPYQWRIDPASGRGLSQAVKVRVEDVQSTPGEGCSLAALAFEMGVLPGTARVPASRTTTG